MDFKNQKRSLNQTIDVSDKELEELQMRIEDFTMHFDEKSIFKETPNLIKKIIGKDVLCAKDYLYKHLDRNLYNSLIEPFGQYTLEAIIIYVLGLLYNSIQNTPVVRVSTLLNKLDSTVKIHANFISPKNQVDSSKEDLKIQKGKPFETGTKLLEFMLDRQLIYIETIEENKAVVKEKGKGYVKSNLFAVCNFELSLLPLKLNFPMVCKPLQWKHESEYDFFNLESIKKDTFMLSDLRGGYLSNPTLDIYNRFSLITSHNLSYFNIELHESKYKDLCNILNGLQNQGFQIHKKILEFIKKNRKTFEKEGLMMPEILAHVNMKEANDLLRISYFHNPHIKSACSLSYLLKEFAKQVQAARYEDFIIRLASAYEDLVFYLPAFMDFRGRIYRSGILHFHERDFSKSLLVFANAYNQQEEGNNLLTKDIVASSAAFKYKKFYHNDDALQWYKENQSRIYNTSDESFISFAKEASDPFQFIAKVLCHDDVHEYNRLPISQDAAASAYQIMSYLLLNEDMARKTNLIPHPDGKIQDVYLYLLKEFKVFLHHQIHDKSKMEIIESKLDRKLIKRLFMPLIYGKTVISMNEDIREKYEHLLSQKDSYNLAKLSNEFWNHKYPDIVNLMKLISLLGWFCSVMDRAVVYGIPYFNTIQDYMSFEKEVIIVYERESKKRRRVTLSVPTTKRDKRKTQSSACVNFIHQKDAYIALQVVEFLLSEGAPIYTVHDNFLTTAPYASRVPGIYTRVFNRMGHPLAFINDLIYRNLILPNIQYIPLHLKFFDERYPISDDQLTDLLNHLIPDTYKSKGKRKIWDKKVSELIKYYNTYVEAVWSNQEFSLDDSSKLIEKNWYQFKKLLENKSHNYSVHY